MNISTTYFYKIGLFSFLFLFSNCQKEKKTPPIENHIEIQLMEAYFGLTYKEGRGIEIQPINALCAKIISHSPTDTLFLYVRPFRQQGKGGIKSHFVAQATYIYLNTAFVETLGHDTVLVAGHKGSNNLVIVPPLDTLDFRLGYEISMKKVGQKYNLDRYYGSPFPEDVGGFLEHLVNAEVKYVPIDSDYQNDDYPIPIVIVKKAPIFKAYFQQAENFEIEEVGE